MAQESRTALNSTSTIPLSLPPSRLRFGRKPMVVVGVCLFVMLGIGAAWLPLLSTILAARFIQGCLYSVVNCTAYTLTVEVTEPKMRVMTGFGFYIIWAVSCMIYGGMGYLIRDWRILQTVMTLPGLLLLPALWLVDESPRWLVVRGRPLEAVEVLLKAARWQGAQLTPESDLKHLVEELQEGDKAPRGPSLVLVLKGVMHEALVLLSTPRLRSITLCLYFDFLMAGIVYFGLSLSGANLSDDPFLYMVLSALMELPAYTVTIPIVQRFGRKRTLSVFFLISSIVLLALAIVPSTYNTTVVTLAMVGKMAITAGFQTVIFFSSELFPTEVSSRGLGTCYMMSRLGGIVSPYINDLVGIVHPWAPFVVFGTGALMAGAGTLLLPETRGKSIPETIAHLEASAGKRTEEVSASRV